MNVVVSALNCQTRGRRSNPRQGRNLVRDFRSECAPWPTQLRWGFY